MNGFMKAHGSKSSKADYDNAHQYGRTESNGSVRSWQEQWSMVLSNRPLVRRFSFHFLKGLKMSGQNNSKTNRSVRRTSALARFKLDPAKGEDKGYQERKAQELESLKKTLY